MSKKKILLKGIGASPGSIKGKVRVLIGPEDARKMEEGDMTLEESLSAFEEGIRLSRLCAEKLDNAERKVEILLKEEDRVSIKPFVGENGES